MKLKYFSYTFALLFFTNCKFSETERMQSLSEINGKVDSLYTLAEIPDKRIEIILQLSRLSVKSNNLYNCALNQITEQSSCDFSSDISLYNYFVDSKDSLRYVYSELWNVGESSENICKIPNEFDALIEFSDIYLDETENNSLSYDIEVSYQFVFGQLDNSLRLLNSKLSDTYIVYQSKLSHKELFDNQFILLKKFPISEVIKKWQIKNEEKNCKYYLNQILIYIFVKGNDWQNAYRKLYIHPVSIKII